jgi:hypothetical protein
MVRRSIPENVILVPGLAVLDNEEYMINQMSNDVEMWQEVWYSRIPFPSIITSITILPPPDRNPIATRPSAYNLEGNICARRPVFL